ncbi:hypothetical protein SAMN06309944_1737 [Micrococcales bacterium KH10]|nr:hypothetical protein SAMN06309944_1737 [Micrococcales bacterium KH10]
MVIDVSFSVLALVLLAAALTPLMVNLGALLIGWGEPFTAFAGFVFSIYGVLIVLSAGLLALFAAGLLIRTGYRVTGSRAQATVHTACFLGAVVAVPVGLFVAWLLLQSIPLVSPGTVMAVAAIFAAVVGYLLCWRTFR